MYICIYICVFIYVFISIIYSFNGPKSIPSPWYQIPFEITEPRGHFELLGVGGTRILYEVQSFPLFSTLEPEQEKHMSLQIDQIPFKIQLRYSQNSSSKLFPKVEVKHLNLKTKIVDSTSIKFRLKFQATYCPQLDFSFFLNILFKP